MGYLHGGRISGPKIYGAAATGAALAPERGTRALREDAMAGYRRMDAVPEKECAGILAEGLRIRVHGNARLRDIRQPEGPGRGDDFVQDPEHVETHDV